MSAAGVPWVAFAPVIMNAPPMWATANNASTIASSSFSRCDMSVSRMTAFGLIVGFADQMAVAREHALALEASRFVQRPRQSRDASHDNAHKARLADARAAVTNGRRPPPPPLPPACPL